MSRFSAALDRAKGLALQTGRGAVGLGRDAIKYVNEPVPVKPPKPKKVGKIPRWQSWAQGVAGVVDHNIAEGTGRKKNRRDRRDFDFGVAGSDNLTSGSDPWGLGFGGGPRNPAIKRKKKPPGGGQNVHIHIHK